MRDGWAVGMAVKKSSQGGSHGRRNQLTHPAYVKPELLALAPNQVWSWDITKLKGDRPSGLPSTFTAKSHSRPHPFERSLQPRVVCVRYAQVCV